MGATLTQHLGTVKMNDRGALPAPSYEISGVLTAAHLFLVTRMAFPGGGEQGTPACVQSFRRCSTPVRLTGAARRA